MSLIFVLLELVMILLLDSMSITVQCRYLRRNLSGLGRRRRAVPVGMSSTATSDTSLPSTSEYRECDMQIQYIEDDY